MGTKLDGKLLVGRLRARLNVYRSLTNFKDDLIMVIDLDQERGIPPREGRTPNQHRVVIRKTSVVNLAAIEAYLEGKMSFGTPILEAISKVKPTFQISPSADQW